MNTNSTLSLGELKPFHHKHIMQQNVSYLRGTGSFSGGGGSHGCATNSMSLFSSKFSNFTVSDNAIGKLCLRSKSSDWTQKFCKYKKKLFEEESQYLPSTYENLREFSWRDFNPKIYQQFNFYTDTKCSVLGFSCRWLQPILRQGFRCVSVERQLTLWNAKPTNA